MRYPETKVKIPDDMKVGCEVGVIGEGADVFTITKIVRNKKRKVVDIHLSCGCREPLCKIYLLRGRSHYDATQDPTSWIQTAIGECDICGVKFPDSCLYHSTPDNPLSMICDKCHKKDTQQNNRRTSLII